MKITIVGFSVAIVMYLAVVVACSNPPSAKTVETDLCKARVDYKLVALAAGGKLDPAPGSARAKLEAAEDAFCANLGK